MRGSSKCRTRSARLGRPRFYPRTAANARMVEAQTPPPTNTLQRRRAPPALPRRHAPPIALNTSFRANTADIQGWQTRSPAQFGCTSRLQTGNSPSINTAVREYAGVSYNTACRHERSHTIPIALDASFRAQPKAHPQRARSSAVTHRKVTPLPGRSHETAGCGRGCTDRAYSRC